MKTDRNQVGEATRRGLALQRKATHSPVRGTFSIKGFVLNLRDSPVPWSGLPGGPHPGEPSGASPKPEGVRGRFKRVSNFLLVQRSTLHYATLIVGAIAFVVAGFVLAGLCGGGLALVLFGIATGLIGGVVALSGGYAVLIPTGLMVVTLVGVGLFIVSSSGCSL